MRLIKIIRIIFILFSGILSLPLWADNFERNASYEVCFTPPQNCTQLIVDAINNSVRSINVQAYSFTSRPIGKALVMAQQRGVEVNVIFDKTVLERSRNTARYFSEHKIPVWIDKAPAIAHNKVMIIDQTKVITGSFNFTFAAQQQNAENVLIIEDATLAKKYLQNWQIRKQASTNYEAGNTVSKQPYDWVSALWNWIKKVFNQLFSHS